TVCTDKIFEEIDPSDADMLILPGGQPGTTNLSQYKPLTDLLTEWNAKGKKMAAICAAPTVFGGLGLLNGRKATCYPGCESPFSVVVLGKFRRFYFSTLSIHSSELRFFPFLR